jgi:hypothetical protein
LCYFHENYQGGFIMHVKQCLIRGTDTLAAALAELSGAQPDLLLAFGDVRFLPTAVWLRICKRPFRRQRYWAVPRPAKLLLTASTMARAR